MLIFFFFQAEDGIRDLTVTGVQTCALPISALSTNLELARRSLSPLTAAQLPRILTQSGRRLSEQPIDLSQETFVLYVPSPAPPQGYTLLVFVPPWQDARVPVGWTSALDRYHVIFVSEIGRAAG